MLNLGRLGFAITLSFAVSMTISFLVIGSGKASPNERRDTLTSVRETANGQRVASESARRFKGLGVDVSEGELDVLLIPHGGGFLVVPKGLDVPPIVKTRASDTAFVLSGQFEVRPSESPDRANGKQVSSRPSFAANWSLITAHCYAHIYADWGGEMATCYKIWKMSNDGSGTWDYWGFETYGTAHSDKSLDYAWIRTDESATGDTQYWVDWDPGSDTSGNCNASYTVTVGGMPSVSHTFVRCESWDITKYSDAAHFKSEYEGNAFNADREVGHIVETKVSDGDSPVWTIAYEFHSCWGWCDTERGP